MKYFFLVMDYILPVLMVISFPWWKKIAQGEIQNRSGIRTTVTMKSKENWRRANILCGKCCVKVGVVLLIFVSLVRWVSPLPMEWNSLLNSTISIVSLLLITVYVHRKIKTEE
ncbi:MAG: SdpI family protein [Tissierellia bacterium]|nr:SdpI family protein [Tissierellia bacterium]